MRQNVAFMAVLTLLLAICLGIYINIATQYYLSANSVLSTIIALDRWNILVVVAMALLYLQIYLSLKREKRSEESKNVLINEILKNASRTLVYPNTRRHIRAIITMVSKDGTKRETKYAYNVLIDPEKNAVFDVSFGVTGEAYSKKIPVSARLADNHIEGYDDTHKNIVSPSLRSILAVPIFSTKEKGEVVGVLAFDSFDDIRHTKFDTKESKQLAQSWANIVSELLDT